MAKRVIRWKPAGAYEMVALEKWLEELAAEEGLFLVQWLPFVAVFEKGEPRNVRYRFELDVSFRECNREEQIAVYRACGWELVDQVAGYYLFRAEEGAEELHTDSELRVEPYEKRMRLMCRNLCFTAATFLILEVMFQRAIAWQPVHWLAEPQDGIALGALLIVILLYHLRELLRMRRLLAGIKAGEAAPEKDWKKVRRERRISNGILALILVLACLPMTINWFVKWEKPHREVENLPYVSLHELLGKDLTDYLYREEWTERFGGLTFGYDSQNGVYYTWAPLAPVRYEETQMDAVEDIKIHVDYIQLRSENLAEAFFEEECAELEERSYLKGKQVMVAGVDAGMLYRSEAREALLFRKGCSVVIYSNYEEEFELEAFLTQIAAGLE